MRNRLAVLTAAIFAGVLSLTAAGASATAATPSVGGYFSTDTHGCGDVKLYVPNQNQFTAQQLGFSRQSIPLRQNVLNKMAGKQVHYLPRLQARPDPPQPVLGPEAVDRDARRLSGNVSGTGTAASGSPISLTTCDNQVMAEPGSVGTNANGPYFVDYWKSFGHADHNPC
jgi:hypothetical protein